MVVVIVKFNILERGELVFNLISLGKMRIYARNLSLLTVLVFSVLKRSEEASLVNTSLFKIHNLYFLLSKMELYEVFV